MGLGLGVVVRVGVRGWGEGEGGGASSKSAVTTKRPVQDVVAGGHRVPRHLAMLLDLLHLLLPLLVTEVKLAHHIQHLVRVLRVEDADDVAPVQALPRGVFESMK